MKKEKVTRLLAAGLAVMMVAGMATGCRKSDSRIIRRRR